MKNNLSSIFFILIALNLKVSAQTKFAATRYDDNLEYLKNDSVRRGLDCIKSIRLGPDNFISFGGELREQFQFYENINFGDVPPDYQNTDAKQLWHRLLVHTNIEIGRHWRFFAQLNNTLRLFNDNPIVQEIDENQLSLHQAFAELKLADWRFRLGQQEMSYGNHRLVTFREGPNTRLAFDGLVVKKKFKNGSIDAFAVSKVISKKYVFDDESMHDGLYGIYGTQYFLGRKFGLDYYLVDFQSRARQYNFQPGFENRQTCGLRFFTNYRMVNFEFEAAYQTGKFNDLSIDAYSFLVDVKLNVLPEVNGIVGFATTIASGDRNQEDDKLNTYNLLYAKPAFGLAAPIGATNIVSFNPYIKLSPLKKLNLLVQVFFLSRQNAADGSYSPAMVQSRPMPSGATDGNQRRLGALYVLESAYQVCDNWSISVDASHFKVGNYPRATGSGHDITYLSLKSTLKL